MTALALAERRIPAMTGDEIARVRALEVLLKRLPQQDVPTDHVIHGGMYARTVMIPAGVVITGALIDVPTILIVDGDATVNTGDGAARLTGYRVLAASAGRRQAFVAHADTHLTMIFATRADDVAQAEGEFTSEADLLLSRQPGATNHITITGE